MQSLTYDTVHRITLEVKKRHPLIKGAFTRLL